jgi:hypothetical protein
VVDVTVGSEIWILERPERTAIVMIVAAVAAAKYLIPNNQTMWLGLYYPL